MLALRVGVIYSLGPCPCPPLVVAGERARALAGALRAALLALPGTAGGAALLAAGGLARFAAVTDSDYDPIRAMADAARDVPDFV